MSDQSPDQFQKGRGARRQPRRVEARPAEAGAILFETFEPRVLLSATPVVPPGTVLATDTAPTIVQDADGTSLTVGVSGSAHWSLVQGAAAPELTVTSTITTSSDTDHKRRRWALYIGQHRRRGAASVG